MQTMDQTAEDGGPARCLSHLMSSEANLLETGERPTFDELISRALHASDDDARRKLVKHGIKLRGFPSIDTRPECLLIARAHPALTKVYAGTLWQGGRSAEDMKHLSGASFPQDQVSFAKGVHHRVVAVPAEHFEGDLTADQPNYQPAPPRLRGNPALTVSRPIQAEIPNKIPQRIGGIGNLGRYLGISGISYQCA